MRNERKINSLSELQREKAELRRQITKQEDVLREHYTVLSTQLHPFFRVVNFISGNRLFKGKQKDDDNAGGGNWTTIISILTAMMGGGILLRKSRKNLFRSLLAYGIDQGVSYVKSKDITEHIDKIKEWLSKSEKDDEDESENKEKSL